MRAEIFDALAALLAAIPGIQGVETRPIHHQHVKPAEMPLLLLLTGTEERGRRVGGDAAPVLRPSVVLYVAEDPAAGKPAGRVLIETLDRVEAGLAGSPLYDGRQPLGGRVHDCFLAGTVDTDDGEWGAKAGAVFTIEIHTQG